MKVYFQFNNFKNIYFKGTSEILSGIAYDSEYDETLKEGSFKMPYKSIYLSDSNKKIPVIEQVSDIPMEEFISDNIYGLLKDSSHYKHNSSIEQVKTIQRKDEIIEEKINGKKEFKKTGKGSYTGKIYFTDMDEIPNSEIRKEHNIIIFDNAPSKLHFENLISRYYDKRKLVSDKTLKNQKMLLASIDYYTRKKETTISKSYTEECDLRVKHAQKILKAVQSIDLRLAQIEDFKRKKENNSENITELESKVKVSIQKLLEYYKANIPEQIKSNYSTTRYI